MKKLLGIILFSVMGISIFSQSLYFPPVFGDDWESIEPESLGWCTDEMDTLYQFLEQKNTKAFLVLKDGKIVLEKYFGSFEQDSLWYWASAGKTLTAFMVGLAQQEGLLSITDSTYRYLGEGWTSCATENEQAITIWHQLTMTSGLDDGVIDPYCTNPDCLECLASPGTRWAYHNAPYTLLDEVIQSATGMDLNAYVNTRLKAKTGMTGFFFPSGYNNVYISTARTMARFGLLILNNGNWNGTRIMTDSAYFQQMVNTSQQLNKSYGFLWWLNGKASFRLPSSQIQFPGSLHPNAPDDMISALGKNGQILNVVPSQNLVMVRMGQVPDEEAIGVLLNDGIWEHFNRVSCTTDVKEKGGRKNEPIIYPNPASGPVHIDFPGKSFGFVVYTPEGKEVFQRTECSSQSVIPAHTLKPGIYYVKGNTDKGESFFKILLINPY